MIPAKRARAHFYLVNRKWLQHAPCWKTIEWNLAGLLKENQKKVVFDLAGVTLVDSTGVGIIVMCYAKLKKSGGVLRVAGVNGMVEDTLRLTSVDKLIEFYPSVAEAAARF